MAEIMSELRAGLSEIGGKKVGKMLDYSKGLDGLPPSDVLKFCLPAASVVVRPSGTEPKLKAYISVTAENAAAAAATEERITADLGIRFGK